VPGAKFQNISRPCIVYWRKYILAHREKSSPADGTVSVHALLDYFSVKNTLQSSTQSLPSVRSFPTLQHKLLSSLTLSSSINMLLSELILLDFLQDQFRIELNVPSSPYLPFRLLIQGNSAHKLVEISNNPFQDNA
jgi:hypothetical protein